MTHRRGYIEVVMRNHEGQAALFGMLYQQRRQQRASRRIEIGVGLIEQPQRSADGQYASHGNPTPLSGG